MVERINQASDFGNPKSDAKVQLIIDICKFSHFLFIP